MTILKAIPNVKYKINHVLATDTNRDSARKKINYAQVHLNHCIIVDERLNVKVDY